MEKKTYFELEPIPEYVENRQASKEFLSKKRNSAH